MELRLGLGQLTAITGDNGTGKSNVYRGLRLLGEAANGSLSRAIADEGGMGSALWAGSGGRKKSDGPTRMSIGFADDDLAYELRLGKPNRAPGSTQFAQDPEVKEETLRTLQPPKARLLERRGVSVSLRNEDGAPVTFAGTLDIGESVLSQLTEPHRYPVLSMLRERLRRWRFYHHFRTDPDSPVRTSHIGTLTPILGHDGRDLSAALQTIIEIGNRQELLSSIHEAFDGAHLEIQLGGDARLALALQMPGIARAFGAAELSDGTLRYLALLAALHSPRPPELLVLNEPETSLNPALFVPLAKQIVTAAQRSQVIVVSHAAALVDALTQSPNAIRIELRKEQGQTIVANRGRLDGPVWQWTS
jgi:predicted ATPase